MNASPIPVSIIIPAYNEQSSIRRCLLAAVAQTVPAHEILVVDNKSTDRTAEIVQEFIDLYPDKHIKLLKQDKAQGLIPTRNFGFANATGEVFGRVDADSVIEPDWVEVLQRVFADPEVAAATGPVGYYDMPLVDFGVAADNRVRKTMLLLAKRYRFVFGSNMALRASAWDAIKDSVALDEEDELHEDIDISVNLAMKELKVAYEPDMVCGISARRIENSPKEYLYYVQRFDRTYDRYNVSDPRLRAPAWFLLAAYFPLKLIRALTRKDRAQSAEAVTAAR
jgi:glycosyltransferase involved in cell wall biosynthesis